MQGLVLALGLLCTPAQPGPDLTVDGELPDAAQDVVSVPFEVPEGVAEMFIVHETLSETNILDWGLIDASGAFRGWGGGNPEPITIGEEAASRSYLRGPIDAGTWQLLIGKALINETPIAYRAGITFRAEATLPPAEDRAPYDTARVVDDGGGWYAGDFHVHSEDSGDATASLDDIGDFAVGRGLDFVVITDHNTTSHFDRLDGAMDRTPGLLFIPGIEVTTYHGHLGLIGATAWLDFRTDRAVNILEAFADDAAAQGALLSINHPVLDLGDACIGCAFDLAGNTGRVDAVEIQTGGNRLFTASALSFWDSVGGIPTALGGSDDHRAGVVEGFGQSPIGTPTTMVEATELSTDGIVAGVRAGRTVVKLDGPDGAMIVLDGPDREGNNVPASLEGPTVIEAKVTGGDGLQLLWIKGGILDTAVDVVGDEATLTIEGGEGDIFRAELWDGETPVTIASPIVIGRSGGDDLLPGPGCVCARPGGGARPAAAIALLLPLAFAATRRRR
jgi:hypothetical protein